MSTPLQVVRAFMSAMEEKDYDNGLKYISPDCEYTNMPMGTVKGPEGVRAVLEPFFAPTLENIFEEKHVTEQGPVVFLERLDRHHLSDKWVELPVVGVFEVHNGLITLWRDYFDLPTIMNHWPQPGTPS